MKAVFSQDALTTALNAVGHGIARRSALPALGHVQIKTGDNDLVTFTATDLSIAVWRSVAATVQQPGGICVPFAVLSNLSARMAEDSRITLSTKTDKTATVLQVRAPRIQSNLTTLAADDFPDVSPQSGGQRVLYATLQLTRSQLKEIADRVMPSVCSQEARPVLTGVNWAINQPDNGGDAGTLRSGAADGFRLAQLTMRDVPIAFEEVKRPKDWKADLDVIVPARAIPELVRLAPEDETLLAIQIYTAADDSPSKDGASEAGTLLRVERPTGGMQISLIDGAFPDVEKVLAENGHNIAIPLPVAETLDALALARIFDSGAVLECDIASNRVWLSCKSLEYGEHRQALPVEFTPADPNPAKGFRIALNITYLKDIVNAAAWGDGDNPVRLLCASASAVVFANARNFRSALMPMNMPEPKATTAQAASGTTSPTEAATPSENSSQTAAVPDENPAPEVTPAEAEEQELRVRLTYTQPPSNKEYRLELVRSGSAWVVNFAYGRIGNALQTGTKTNKPLDYKAARKVYDRQLNAKVSEGYVFDGSASTAGYQAPTAKEDTGLRPQLLEPISLDAVGPYVAGGEWWMQQKFDGNRVFLVITPKGEVYGANRKGQKISLPLNLAQWVVQNITANGLTSIVLDGELVGETYYAFDILESKGASLVAKPYADRLSTLEQIPVAGGVLTVAQTARTSEEKTALLERLQSENAEGVVFKRSDTPYMPGRFPTQVKCKFWESASFIVRAQNEGVRSIELGLLGEDGVTLEGWGNCTVPTNYSLPAVDALVEVKYLYVDDNVYQPQYKGERTDIDRSACTPTQLKFKPGSRRIQPATP